MPALTARLNRAVTYARIAHAGQLREHTTDHERKPPWRERKEAHLRHGVDVWDRFNACGDCQRWYYSELRAVFARRVARLAAEPESVGEQFPEGAGTCDGQCTASDD